MCLMVELVKLVKVRGSVHPLIGYAKIPKLARSFAMHLLFCEASATDKTAVWFQAQLD